VFTFRQDLDTPFTTNFALPITTGMSFNRSMWHTTASVIAHEARALMNVGNAWSTFWTPVVNIARDPRWGRNIESPGEVRLHVCLHIFAFLHFCMFARIKLHHVHDFSQQAL
jgi:beta-glucosidase-like glycosyl hydrolase